MQCSSVNFVTMNIYFLLVNIVKGVLWEVSWTCLLYSVKPRSVTIELNAIEQYLPVIRFVISQVEIEENLSNVYFSTVTEQCY